jgi:hypothetical protein
MRILNSEMIISITVRNKIRLNEYEYVPAYDKKKRVLSFFGFKMAVKHIPESWYEFLVGSFSREHLLSEGYMIDELNNVYARPRVTLHFVNDHLKIKRFDTLEEANAYAQEMADKYIPKNNQVTDNE